MKAFQLPSNAWLTESAFSQLNDEYRENWSRVDSWNLGVDPGSFSESQNQTMLLKFFLEQAFGDGNASGRALSLIERDSGGLAAFRQVWSSEAEKESIDWVVWGLSFADFRFHLFSFGRGIDAPFCVSPMLCSCFRRDIVELSGMSRGDFAERQWEKLDWTIVEQRIACLEKPLDVFDDAVDCVEQSCDPNDGEGSKG